MRTRSNVGFKQPGFEAVPEDTEVMVNPVIGFGRTDASMSKKAPKGTGSMKNLTSSNARPSMGF